MYFLSRDTELVGGDNFCARGFGQSKPGKKEEKPAEKYIIKRKKKSIRLCNQ